MHVAELWRYPVKSMGGEQLTETPVDLRGVPGDRAICVVDARGEILSARTRPELLRHRATLEADGEVHVDGLAWRSPEIAAAVEAAAGSGARLVAADGPERFDILPLIVVTDGALAAYGHDHRRLRPNVVIGGVEGLAERGWEGRQLAVGETVIGLADLRGRCVMTTFHPRHRRAGRRAVPPRAAVLRRHLRPERLGGARRPDRGRRPGLAARGGRSARGPRAGRYG